MGDLQLMALLAGLEGLGVAFTGEGVGGWGRDLNGLYWERGEYLGHCVKSTWHRAKRRGTLSCRPANEQVAVPTGRDGAGRYDVPGWRPTSSANKALL